MGGIFRSSEDAVVRVPYPALGTDASTYETTFANLRCYVRANDGTSIAFGFLNALTGCTATDESAICVRFVIPAAAIAGAGLQGSCAIELFVDASVTQTVVVVPFQWGGTIDLLAGGATAAEAVDTLTKAGGPGDLAAVKAVTDLLPNAGALTGIAADALTGATQANLARKALLNEWVPNSATTPTTLTLNDDGGSPMLTRTIANASATAVSPDQVLHLGKAV